MKTLKQFFQQREKQTQQYIDDSAIEAVKEWLTQKRQETKHFPWEKIIIEELLEELNQ